MPAKLIKNFGGIKLEVEVMEWSEHIFRAAYTIDGNYAVTLKCIRTKDYPEGESTISAARLLPSFMPFAAAFSILVGLAVRDGDQIASNGGIWQPELSALPCGATIQ